MCEETRAEDILLPLAVNLLDRILSQQFIDRDHLQLTSAACLFVASKVVQAEPLEAKQLCIMSDNAFMPSFLTVSVNVFGLDPYTALGLILTLKQFGYVWKRNFPDFEGM